MTARDDLAALAARVEAAEGASRELDAAIHGRLGYCLHPHKERSGAQSDTGFTCTSCGADSWGNKGPKGERLYDYAPAYTASLDAAASLVPRGCLWTLDCLGNATALYAGRRHQAEAATPALALCAAALRAMAELERMEARDGE